MKTIEITRNMVAIVDDEDYERISKHSWAFCPNKYPNGGYAIRSNGRVNGKRKMMSMHREILDVADFIEIDHINGCGLDNRKCNLRIATTQTNAFNRAKPNVPSTSRYKGVLRRKSKRYWEARIKYNNKAIYLGTFVNEAEGAAAYNYAARLMYGEYARLNEGTKEPPPDVKRLVYERCLKMVMKQNWHPMTGVFFVHEDLVKEAIGNV